MKQARLWVLLDGAAWEVKEAIKKLHDWTKKNPGSDPNSQPMTLTISDRCDIVKTDAHGHSQVVRNVFGSQSRDVWWGVALGFSLAVNLIAILYWRHAATEAQVKDYNLSFFLTHDWVQVKTQVETDKNLIEAYWPRKLSEEIQDGRRRSDHNQERDQTGIERSQCVGCSPSKVARSNYQSDGQGRQ